MIKYWRWCERVVLRRIELPSGVERSLERNSHLGRGGRGLVGGGPGQGGKLAAGIVRSGIDDWRSRRWMIGDVWRLAANEAGRRSR